MNINKNISVWRGDSTPPTKYHLWIKSDGTQYTFDGYEWVKMLDQIPLVSHETNGMMSKEDKQILDTINNDIPNYKELVILQINYLKDKDKLLTDNLEKEVERATNAEGIIQGNLTTHIENKSNPHEVTKTQIGLSDVTNDAQVKRSEMGVANGVATLDNNGLVPSNLLPSYVDDILEFDNINSFPRPGESGKIYVATSTGYTYRWSGSTYIATTEPISSDLYQGLKRKSNGLYVSKHAKDMVTDLLTGSLEETLANSYREAEIINNVDDVEITFTNNNTDKEVKQILSATTTKAGVMSAADKLKLEDISGDYITSSQLDTKVDKVDGKGLSTNDYTTDEKNKLANIEANANNYSLPAASSTTRGGVKLGYVENDKNYPVEASEEKLFVNVPWVSITANSTLDGLMSSSDKSKLDDINISNYYTKTEIDATKANIDDLSNVLAEEVLTQPTLQEINDVTREELKKDLFIDMWNKACGWFGTYNAETGYFELNGLTDITYEQALNIYNEGYTKYPNPSTISNKCRTNILAPTNNGYLPASWTCDLSRLALLASNLEVLRINDNSNAVQTSEISGMLYAANKLKKVIGSLSLGKVTNTNITWAVCSNLEELFMSYLKTNIKLERVPKLNLASFQFLIANAINTAPITIIVHPDVYAKLTDASNTEWNKVLTDAAAKQISFVTT